MHGINAILGAAISIGFVERPVTIPLTRHLDFHSPPQQALAADSNREYFSFL
jgi:hypothetical protein